MVRGDHTIADNVNTADGDYAAHTRGCNTSSIGVSMACMAGAVESHFNAGKFPMTETQWNRAMDVIAHLCSFYKIPVTDKTVLLISTRWRWSRLKKRDFSTNNVASNLRATH